MGKNGGGPGSCNVLTKALIQYKYTDTTITTGACNHSYTKYSVDSVTLQIRRRRPTPATLVASSDQSSPGKVLLSLSHKTHTHW